MAIRSGNWSPSGDGAGSSPGRNSRPCPATRPPAIWMRSAPTRTRPLTTKTATAMTDEALQQTGEPPRQGLLDTNILVLRRWIDPAELPDEMAISAVTLAELSAGPHQVRPNGEQDIYDEHEERACRTEALQRAESEF